MDLSLLALNVMTSQIPSARGRRSEPQARQSFQLCVSHYPRERRWVRYINQDRHHVKSAMLKELVADTIEPHPHGEEAHGLFVQRNPDARYDLGGKIWMDNPPISAAMSDDISNVKLEPGEWLALAAVPNPRMPDTKLEGKLPTLVLWDRKPDASFKRPAAVVQRVDQGVLPHADEPAGR